MHLHVCAIVHKLCAVNSLNFEDAIQYEAGLNDGNPKANTVLRVMRAALRKRAAISMPDKPQQNDENDSKATNQQARSPQLPKGKLSHFLVQYKSKLQKKLRHKQSAELHDSEEDESTDKCDTASL